MLRARSRRREESFEEHLPDPDRQPRTALATRGGGAARGLGRSGPPRRARRLDPSRASRLRSPRHVRAAVRRDRADGRSNPRGDPAARQPCSSPGERCRGTGLPTPTSRVSARSWTPSSGPRAAATSTALVAVLDPDVVLREDFSVKRPIRVFRGASAVASQARGPAHSRVQRCGPAVVNGAAGAVILLRGRPFAVLGFTVAWRPDRRDRCDRGSRACRADRRRAVGVTPRGPGDLRPWIDRKVALEQPGQLPRPTQRRTVAAVDLVGRDPEPVADHRPQPLRREEAIVPADDRASRDVRPRGEWPGLGAGRVRLAAPMGQRLFGEIRWNIVVEDRDLAVVVEPLGLPPVFRNISSAVSPGRGTIAATRTMSRAAIRSATIGATYPPNDCATTTTSCRPPIASITTSA